MDTICSDAQVVDLRVEFFNKLSVTWDGEHDLPALQRRLDEMLGDFELSPDEVVVDAGCGTGNLTLALLRHLGGGGRVIAVDFSPVMLERAFEKVNDTRVTWALTSVENLPLTAGSADRVVCFSAWPHFRNQERVVAEFGRVLKPGAMVHIVHFISRRTVNLIHSNVACPIVREDLLAPANEVAELFTGSGFRLMAIEDADDYYLVSLKKSCGGSAV